MATTKEFNISSNAVTVLNQTADAAENTAKGFTSAKAELRALQNQMLQMDQSSEEFKKASARASELKDRIEELGENVRANVGNSFEQASNSVSLFTSRIMGGDFKGAGDALTNLGGVVGKISFKEIQQEVGGLMRGLFNLGKAVLANPFFLSVGVLTAMIVYWKEINDLISNKSGVIKSLQQQSELLTKQTRILERNVNLLKSTKASAGEIYQAELDVLGAKEKQLTAAYKLALLEGEQAAINESRAALDDLRAEKQAKLNATIAEGHTIAQDIVAEENKDVALQQAKIKASQQYVDKAQQLQIAIGEQKKQQDKLNIELQKAAEYANEFRGDESEQAKFARADLKRAQERVTAQEKLIKQSEKDLQIIKAKGVEVWNNTKTAEEQAKIDEQAAIRKAKREAEAKKLADELLAIEKEIAEFKRRGMDDIEAQIFQAEERYKIQRETYIRAKKSKEELAQLELLHNIHIEEILQKGDAEQAKIDKEANDLKLKQEKDTNDKLNEEREKQNEANAIAAAKELALLKQAEQAKAQLRIDAMKTSLSIISDLAGAFAGQSERQQKKAFQIQKGVSIATATIDTYLAAQGAYRSQMAISTPDAPVRAAVAAGIAIAQGLARVAIISKQQFNGGGSTSGGNGGGSLPSASGGTQAPSPANFAFLGMQPQQQPPLQAYVVSGQVSSNLEAQQLINNQARLGG